MTTTTAQPRTIRESEGRAPCLEDAALKTGKSALTVGHSGRTVNAAVEASFGQTGVQIVPVTDSRALERACVHDVLLDGRRIGGVCWARGAWRILSNAQAKFASREAAVDELLRRRGCSQ